MRKDPRSPIDRAAPTRRPHAYAVSRHEWRRLLFLHWAVDPAALRPLVPAHLSLDLWESRAYVGLVAFHIPVARPTFGLSESLGLSFLETNVRTYVHVDGRDPGVYFFSLDAASMAAVLGARALYGLPYFYAAGTEATLAGVTDYQLARLPKRTAACHVRYRAGSLLGSSEPGTLEYFLLERYLLHVQRGPSIWTTQVHHQPYPRAEVELLEVQDSLVSADGIRLPNEPPLVHYSPGVDVEVFAPRPRRTLVS